MDGNEDDRGCQRTPPAPTEAEASDAKRRENRDDNDDETRLREETTIVKNMTIDTMIYDNDNANNGDQYDDNGDQDEDAMMLRHLPHHH